MLTDIRRVSPRSNRELVAAMSAGDRSASWWGSSLAALGLNAHPGAALCADELDAVFGQLRHPQTGTSIGSKPRDYRATAGSARPMAAVAYYSFSFAPVKSLSVLYAALLAAGRGHDASRLRRCHDRAVEIALSWAEPHLAVSRTSSRHPSRFEAGGGLVGAIAPRVVSSSGDPHLNALIMVLNRTQLGDGRVGALWGRAIGLTARGMSLVYDRTLEALASDTLGVS